MDIGRAVGFVFDDPEWVKKLLIGGLINLSAVIIPVIGTWIIYGYMLEITRQVYLGQDVPLPEWNDLGGYLVRGLLVSVGFLIWLLPAMLLTGCVAGAIIIAGSASGDDTLAVFSGLLAFGIFGVLILLVIVWAFAFLPIIGGRYAVERRFGAMFEFSAIFAEIRQTGFTPLLLLMVVGLIAGFISDLGFILCIVGIFVTSFYANLMLAHGAGQVYRRARGLDAATTSLSTPDAPSF